MYEQFYGLDAVPFAARPAAGEYYFNEQQRQILEELETRAGQGNGICILGGAEGVGKSALADALCRAIGDRAGVIRVDAAGESPLAEKLLAALGGEADGDVETSAEARLASLLEKPSGPDHGRLLVIDHADELTAADSQVLAGLVSRPGLQALLLSEQAGEPDVAGQVFFPVLSGHIVERYTLLPLSPVETETYIRVRLIQAGGSPDLFAPEAVEAVHEYSQGLPRLINRICDLALVYGFSRQSESIDRQVIDFVRNDRWGGRQQAAGEDGAVVNAEASPAATQAEPGAGSANPASGDVATANTADAEIARQLIELLRQGQPPESKTDAGSERDIYDFIRLSMKYHQRHLERFTIGVVAGVILLAAGGIWGFIAWQNGALPPVAAMAQPGKAGAEPASVVTWEAPAPAIPMRASVVRRVAPPEENVVKPVAIPPVETAALEVPVEREEPPVAAAAAAEQAERVASIEARNRALQAERKRLEQERRRLKKKLAAQRAENERLQREKQREHERALEAQMQVREARRTAQRMTWDKLNTSTPDAFPEE